MGKGEKMSDYMVRAMAAQGQVRLFAATTKDLTETARKAHQTSPTATAALGRLLTAGVMMGSMLKSADDRLTLQIRSDGPIGGLLVTADAKGNVKGYVNHPAVDLPLKSNGKLDVGRAVGNGQLTVTRDMGLKEPYTGTVQLVSGEIAEDLTYYFAASEQIPSSVGLGVLVNPDGTVRQAGGFILQLLPFAKDAVIDRLEANIQSLPSVTTMLEQGLTPELILKKLTEGLELEIMDQMPVQFYCDCSRKKVEQVLISTGKKEIASMIADGKPIEVNCQFCGKHFTYTVDELRGILETMGSGGK